MHKPGDKGFDVPDEKYQPAKLSDRKRDGQATEQLAKLGSTAYGMGDQFNMASKVTKGGGNYAELEGRGAAINDSEKNADISRLDMRNKMTANSGTAYNGKPIPETYKPATSNGVPNADAVQYKTLDKDRNA